MNLKSAIESLLFLQGEPVAIRRLAKATGATPQEISAALDKLQEEYRERGIQLIRNGDEWQFASHPDNKEIVEKFVATEHAEELSRAALEVLTIIAYKGPTSRARIEYIRGVNSSFTLRNLLIRGLIERAENPHDRRSYLYRISADFLKYIGITCVGDLPHYDEFSEKDIEPPDDASP